MEMYPMRSKMVESMEKNPEKKTRTYITIEISKETYDKIRSIAMKLAQILHKNKVSTDQALSVLMETNPLDVVLQRLLEEKW